MSPFEQVLCIAQEQLAAVSRGDLVGATDRLDERGLLLSRAPAPQPARAGGAGGCRAGRSAPVRGAVRARG